MTSFADSEKRLIAALGRIDRALDRDTPENAADADLRAENAALKQRLATLEAELAAARRTTAPADAELQSELDLMRSTRAAEIAALDDIMSGVELLIERAPRGSDGKFVV